MENNNMSTDDVRQKIVEILLEKKAQGENKCVLVSGAIHNLLGLKDRMPTVCNAMKSIDYAYCILHNTPSGQSSTIKIRYYLTQEGILEEWEEDLDNKALKIEETFEGKSKYIKHFTRERNSQLSRNKKTLVFAKTGKLECEICGFNFREVYKNIVELDFCEAHHKKPISEYDGEENTRLEDLAILCSNCHRAIHLTKPMFSVEEFRKKFLEK